ncbi:chemotaxis-specific protein-glutamate methyltransferase CheB [Pannus brasiliensis CCIBt3594]|uniref:Protein-glutamate methylesterase/protein-glutamine glutaminase n=1 Tax=Pannus brasiliensis CCIBt3594 TaxID=1427578 RepID=A0AAW9QVH9_9CHRO
MTIRVLLVEDSPVATTILTRMISSAEDMKVVGTARTGVDALEMIPKVKPDVICTDLLMPKMNGLELTQNIMERSPKPILVVSACVQDEDKNNVFQLLDAGAVDVFPKPRSGQIEEYEQLTEKLLTKIRVLAGVKVFTKRNKGATLAIKTQSTPVKVTPTAKTGPLPHSIRVVAIGASTGGPQAFQEILHHLPADFPLPILCVQHISKGFLNGFLDWLRQTCRPRIEIAKTGDSPERGTIYFPPERQHLQIDAQGRFYCVDGPLVDGHCPSATVLFQSVAGYYRSTVLGILLSGMGRDGAAGLLTIKQKGGYTIAQNEESSVVFGMPQEAIRLGATKAILSLSEIGPKLLEIMS